MKIKMNREEYLLTVQILSLVPSLDQLIDVCLDNEKLLLLGAGERFAFNKVMHYYQAGGAIAEADLLGAVNMMVTQMIMEAACLVSEGMVTLVLWPFSRRRLDLVVTAFETNGWCLSIDEQTSTWSVQLKEGSSPIESDEQET